MPKVVRQSVRASMTVPRGMPTTVATEMPDITTAAARQCLAAAERAAVEVAAAVGEVRGRLSVGVISSVAAVDIPGALRDFRRRYPKVRVSLRVGASEELVERVGQGDIEVAFLGLPTTARPRGVEAHAIGRDRLVAVVAPGHPLAGRGPVDLRRLAEEEFVDLPARTAGRIQSDLAFSTAGRTPAATAFLRLLDVPDVGEGP